MKITKSLTFILLVVSLILPYVALAHATEVPRYVGVNEDQEIIWNTEFDKDPIESYFEDTNPGYTDEQYSDAADAWFDLYEWDDDAVKWKVVITDVKEEDKDDYNGENINAEDIKLVKLTIAIYDQEEGDEWDDIDKSEKFIIYEPEEEIYADIVIVSMDDDGMGLTSVREISDTPRFYTPEWPCFFVPKNLNWGDICGEVEDELDGDLLNRDEYYDVGTEDLNFFFRNKDVGLSTTVERESPGAEDFESVTKFNDNGVMYYYEYSYDGEAIVKFELDTIGGVYLIENWWWIALIVGAVIVAVIVIIVVVAKKRR